MTVKERERQREDALERANAIRVDKAKLKREIAALSPKDAMSFCADLIDGALTPAVGAMTIREMLSSVRSVSTNRARLLTKQADQFMSVDAKFRDLTHRQRVCLAKRMRGTAFTRALIPNAKDWLREVPAGRWPTVPVTPDEDAAWRERGAA